MIKGIVACYNSLISNWTKTIVLQWYSEVFSNLDLLDSGYNIELPDEQLIVDAF